VRYKEEFEKLCKELELELVYRLGITEDELKVVEEYFKIKHDAISAGGIAYKHATTKLNLLKSLIANL